MNKISTTIEQSKKFIELGIDINTADMHYSTWTILDGEYILSPNQGESIKELQEEYGNQIIPAWSLTALLGLMPIVNENTYKMCGTLDGGAIVSHDELTCVMYQEENPIDAVFEMIVWLKENNKI